MTWDSSKEIHIFHADAGSGKTTTLMGIVEDHVKKGTPLDRIAFVTYTKAAATVAQERVCNRLHVDIKAAPHFRTIHSMCFQHLHMKKNLMMDDDKYQDFGIKAGYAFKRNNKKDLSEVEDWSNLNDNQLIGLEQLYRNNQPMARAIMERGMEIGSDSTMYARFVTYCNNYVNYKNTFDYKDFTDLLEEYMECELYEDVDVVCIDEAQDCTPLQWKVLFSAFRYAKYIYIAGDLKQQLYGFNGADSELLASIRGTQHILDKSYRVPKNINDYVKDHIVRHMRGIPHTECLSSHEGGTVTTLNTIMDLPSIEFGKTYMFLARNRKLFSIYTDFLKEICVPYSISGIPLFSNQEKIQYREKMLSTWKDDKFKLAQRYEAAGTFYQAPRVRIDTIHGVKGDEADVVVLMPDMRRPIWRSYAQDPDVEHKVFYVGCTRAIQTLYILEPHSKYFMSELFE